MRILQRLMMAFRHPLTCEDVNHFLEAYLDDDLETDVRTKFERHLDKCPNCSTYFDQYQTTVRLIKEVPAPEPPPELVALTLDFLNQHIGDEPAAK